jgi:O-antigen/teichoic acid export membrane protein
MIRKFFRDAGYLLVIELLIRFKAIIALPLLTQRLGAEAYGAWSQVAVVVATVIPLAILGTDSAVMRFLPGSQAVEKRRQFTAWMVMLFVMSGMGAALLLLLRGPVTRFFFADHHQAWTLLLFAGASLCVTILLNGLRNWFRLNDNALGWGMSTGLQAFLNLAGIVAAITTEADLVAVLLYTLVADMVSALCLAGWIALKRGWGTPDLSILPALVRFGLPLVPMGFAMWGLNYVDRVVIVKYGTMSDIGVYSVAYTLGSMAVQMLMGPIWAMYYPTVAALQNEGCHERIQPLFNHSVGSILLIVLPVITGLAVLGRPLITVIAGDAFVQGAAVMWMVALGYLFSMLSSYCEASLSLAFRQYFSTVAMFLALAVNLVLNLIWVPKYSIHGAAAATLVAFMAQFLFTYAMVMRLGLLRMDLIFAFKVCLAALLMGAFISILYRYNIDMRAVGIVACSMGGALAYLFIIRMLRILPQELQRQVLSSLRSKLKS